MFDDATTDNKRSLKELATYLFQNLIFHMDVFY